MTEQDVFCYGKCQVCIQVSELQSEMLSGSWRDLKLVGAEWSWDERLWEQGLEGWKWDCRKELDEAGREEKIRLGGMDWGISLEEQSTLLNQAIDTEGGRPKWGNMSQNY